MKAVMDIRKINRGLSVSPQIAPADMAELKMAGFRAIICNRPDGEGNGPADLSRKSRRPPAPPASRLYMPIVPKVA
jgi:sulfide:quinone oxidoreductase